MKTLTKFAFFAALCGVFAGCGSDSGSNSGSSELPESIKNFSDIADYDCNDARQCAKLYVEEYSDTMQCVNGEWETLISSMKNSCSDSSVILDPDRGSSSSSKDESSSSSKKFSFSSSDESGVAQEDESSSSIESSSSSMKTAWDYLNPKISYGEMTDSRDGQIYKTVVIGEQTWMAQNLNYAYNEPTATEDSSSFCYDNSANSCAKYGRLYLWSAAMDSAAVFGDDGKGCGYRVTCSAGDTVRGVCPEGWHLPNTTEWKNLFTAVGGVDSAGTMLKSTSGWYDGGSGDDSYGFSVLPAGDRVYSGNFYSAGSIAYFWSSTECCYSNYAYRWYFHYNYACVSEYDVSEDQAFSVRCVKD